MCIPQTHLWIQRTHRTEQLAEQLFVICPSNLNLVQEIFFFAKICELTN